MGKKRQWDFRCHRFADIDSTQLQSTGAC